MAGGVGSPDDGHQRRAPRHRPGGARLHGPRPGARAALPDGLAGRRRDVHGRVEGRVHDPRAAGALALGSTNSCDLHPLSVRLRGRPAGHWLGPVRHGRRR